MTPTHPEKKIAEIRDLIARSERRLRKLQARSDPGIARMVHALMNSIRKHRRNLQKALGSAKQRSQLRRQQAQLQQAQLDAPSDRSGELPERQDQEPRDPTSDQGVVAGQ
jgi:hypothetical protein